MLILEHNITTDRFKRIVWEPSSSNHTRSIFEKTEGEGEIIRREIKPLFRDNLVITAYREFTVDGIEYIQKYKFAVSDFHKTNNSYDDDYIHIAVENGRLLKPQISKPVFANKGLDKVMRFGYDQAKCYHQNWMIDTRNRPERYPLDNDGFPVREKFEALLNCFLWDGGFELIAEDKSLSKVLDSCGTDKFGYAFFEGVHKYIDEQQHLSLRAKG